MLCHSKQSVNIGIINNPMSGDTGLKKKTKRVNGKKWKQL